LAIGGAPVGEGECDACARQIAAAPLERGAAACHLEDDLAAVALLGAAFEQAARHGARDLAAGTRGIDAEPPRDFADGGGLGDADGVEQAELGVIELRLFAEGGGPELGELLPLEETPQGHQGAANRFDVAARYMCLWHLYAKRIYHVHALDNPVWSSLTTSHRGLALACGGVLRYPADVAPFVAIAEPGPVASSALDTLVGDETVFMLGPKPALPPGWVLGDLGVIVQMVCEATAAVVDGPPIVELGASDREAVLALAALVYPHYFRSRTMELGRYCGIVAGGRLDAMIGERMAMPGLREISAVCTHPEQVGRGLARRLLTHASNELLARGEMPFLHVSPDNERAVRLYESNGYRRRIDVPFWSVARDQ